MNKSRILIVNDNADHRKEMINLLKSDSFEILEVETGPEALALMKEKDVDLVLLDVILQGMSGYEVCRRIKRDPDLFLPVLMVKNTEEKDVYKQVFMAGAEDIFIRPLRKEVFVMRVHSYLKMKAMCKIKTNKIEQSQMTAQGIKPQVKPTAILDKVTSPIQIIDNNGVIVYENQEAIKILGKARKLQAADFYKQKHIKGPATVNYKFTDPDFEGKIELTVHGSKKYEINRYKIIRNASVNYTLFILKSKSTENEKQEKANHSNLRSFLRNF